MSLENKKVLVTGGARGIGFETAQLFLDRGADVAVWALHEESIQAAKEQFSQPVFGQAVDVGDIESVQTAAKQLREEFGSIDVLVNNAGYTLTTRFLTEDRSYWERVVATNLWGVIYTMREFLDDMIASEKGSIVNVVSDAGRVGMSGEAVYAASKGGVVAFSKSMAQEVARYGVRVNCVSPGPTRTGILESNSEDEQAKKLIDKMIRKIPLRQIAEPKEVAEAIVFFGGDGASHVTGQVLSVSGGLTMSD
ncbi:MAG TPA: SDR family NAD(P)-dependent oxidoreductase [Bacillales bacterium]|nr:SDR family NAD(P)-dependent oxidoreductase [Bacillales bacterium]